MLGHSPSAKHKNQRKMHKFKSLKDLDRPVNVLTQLYDQVSYGGYTVTTELGQ